MHYKPCGTITSAFGISRRFSVVVRSSSGRKSKFKAQGRTIDGAVVFVIVKLVELDTGLYVITVYRADKRPEATKAATGTVVVMKKKRRTP